MGSYNSKIDEQDIDESKDALFAMQGWIESKLKNFSVEVEQELVQAAGTRAIKIPIASVIDIFSDIYIQDAKDEKNAISDTIQGAVGNIFKGDWKDAISDVLSGVLHVFLGDREVATQGTMKEHRSFHVVWSETSLIRLDLYVLRFDVSTKSDYKQHAETFFGYTLIRSVVDADKTNPQIIAYELVKFLDTAGRSKDAKGNLIYESPKEILMKEMKDSKEIFEGVSDLLKVISTHQRGGKAPVDVVENMNASNDNEN